jgi:hypothetical protein
LEAGEDVPKTYTGDGCVNIGSVRVSMRPRFDKDGIPVTLLSSVSEVQRDEENISERERMVEKMREYGQLRPRIIM